MEVDVGRPAAAFEHELASKDMILAHPRRTDEEHVWHGTFRNEFQKRESMVARYQETVECALLARSAGMAAKCGRR
jgi:hypothetical protein